MTPARMRPDRPTYLVRLQPESHVLDPVKVLRRALKRLLRSYGLKAVEVKEEAPR